MDLDAYKKSPNGSLERIAVEENGTEVIHSAFVPDDLPADLELSQATWAAAAEAAERLGRLDALASALLPNPMLLARPMIRREAVSTSALEGTFAAAETVLASEADTSRPRTDAVTEILNFVEATDRAITLLEELPVCIRLARELQSILISGTSSEDWQTGKVRETQVLIGPYRGCSVLESHYVPPPPGAKLAAKLDAWEKWIHDDNGIHVVVKAAIGHYQFEALHPFTDGNGRIGRLLAILQFIEAGILSAPILNLSPYLEVRSDQYRHLLRSVSTDGDWDTWTQFFCRAISDQALGSEDRIKRLLGWAQQTVADLRANGVKGVAIATAEQLIEQPLVTVKYISQRHDVSNQAANAAVKRLVEAGVVREISGKSYNRVFQADAVMAIAFSPPSRERT